MKTIFTLALLLLAQPVFAQCVPASPQTTPATFTCVADGSTHTARFEPPTGFLAGDQYRLYVNNTQVGANVPAVAGTATVDILFGATMPAGSYTVQAATYRSTASPAEARTPAVNLVITSPTPGAPVNFRIVMEFRDRRGNLIGSFIVLEGPVNLGQ